jgi:hypothetical protein
MTRRFPRVLPRSRRFTPRFEWLEAREVPSVVTDLPDPSIVDDAEIYQSGAVNGPLVTLPRSRFVVASDAGGEATVNVYDTATNALIGIITPFGRGANVSTRVAVGDVTGDGVSDIIVAAGAGSKSLVKVFDGKTLVEVKSFLAYADDFTGGVFVAAGDMNGDGVADIVTGAGENGGPHVKVFSGVDLFPKGDVKLTVEPYARQSFFAYEKDFTGGVSVAVADINGDGYADLITGAGPGGGPRVIVLSGQDGSQLANYFAYDSGLRSGIMVTAGTLTGVKANIVVVPMAGGGPEVKVFEGDKLLTAYTPFGSEEAGNGVAIRDLNADGIGDILVTSGPGQRPKVLALSGKDGKILRDFPAFMPEYTGGLFVA